MDDSLTKRRWWRGSLALLALGALSIGLVACGDDDDDDGGSGDGGIPTDTAETVVPTTLLAPEDLPGEGWTVESEAEETGDPLGEVDNLLDSTDVPECDATNDALAGLDAESSGTLVFGMNRDLAQPPNAFGFQTSLTSGVSVYPDGDDISDDLPKVRDIVDSDDFTSCLEAALNDEISQDADGIAVEVDFESVDPAVTNLPGDGITLAYNADIAAGPIALSLHFEQYFWVQGNALVHVMISGTEEDLTAEFVSQVITKQREKVAAAAE